jgi:hypothetical protein
MPIAAPLAVMVGTLLSPEIPASKSQLMQHYTGVFKGLRWIIGLVLALWLLFWAIPFVFVTLNAPKELPFDSSNWLEYHSGILTADEATVKTATIVNQLDTTEAIYASWNLCHIIYFLIEQEITCIPQEDAPGHLVQAVQALAEGDSLILLLSGYPPYYEDWDFISSTLLAENDHGFFSRPIQVIRIQYNP